MASQKKFLGINLSFLSGVSAIRIFNQQIGKFADEHDRRTLENFTKFIDFLKPRLAQGQDIELSAKEGNESTPEINMRVRLSRDDLLQLRDVSMDLLKNSPIQGILLRRGALINLVSQFENLISDLLTKFYEAFPEALPDDGHTLTLAELRQLGSLEEAERYLVSKEVDSVLRKDTPGQLQYFVSRLKLETKVLEPIKETLFEVVQRRNICVHNDGIVNRYYIRNVSPELLQKFQAEDGKALETSETYLEVAADTIYLAGTLLLQTCWRKWNKSEAELADRQLVIQSYECLVENKWGLANQLLDYTDAFKVASDKNKRILIINKAITLKEQGELEKMQSTLESLDWSSSSLLFKLALTALRDQEDEFFTLLPKAVAAEEIDRSSLEGWPLFRKLRESERFGLVLQNLWTDSASNEILPEESKEVPPEIT
jgi:hypothetical protein